MYKHSIFVAGNKIEFKTSLAVTPQGDGPFETLIRYSAAKRHSIL